MTSSSARFKLNLPSIGRPPRRREKVVLDVYIDSDLSYVIDNNTYDIVEGDDLVISLHGIESLEQFGERYCSFMFNDHVESVMFEGWDVRVPRHIVIPCKLGVVIDLFTENDSARIDMTGTPIKIGSWYDR